MKNDTLKFINLTDVKRIRYKLQPRLSEADKAKAVVHLSNFYAITNGQALLYVEDAGEILLLNTKTKRIGVTAFNIPCKLKPDAPPKRIRKAVRAFRRAYQHRN